MSEKLQCKAVPPAPTTDRKVEYIKIFHPSDQVEEFLRLPALDTFVSNTNTTTGNVHHRKTALDMCRILAGNKSGYFTLLGDPANLRIPDSQWLEPACYTFYLHSGDSQYPIIPKFTAWKYPEQLPDSWKALKENLTINTSCSKSSVTATVRNRDGRCRVCGEKHGLTSAHLVPASEKLWFIRNKMRDYCANPNLGDDAIDDVANQVGMRMDLHILAFDRSIFTIAAKDGQAVVHFLNAMFENLSELIPPYHNSIFDTDGISIALLYSRFAWSIFSAGILQLSIFQTFLIQTEDGLLQSTKAYLAKPKPKSKSRKPKAGSEGGGDLAGIAEDDDKMEEEDSQGDDSQSEDDQSESEESEKPVKMPPITADTLKDRFPFFFTENGMADPHEYEMLAVYPEMEKIAELKAKWIEEHPQIHLLVNPGEPSTA